MGDSSSKPVLKTPWRELKWEYHRREVLQYVKNFQPQNQEAKAIRVLLFGAVGAGKSSFINSVNNVLQGRMTDEALACAPFSSSFTKKYDSIKIKNYPIVFNDIMGLEEGDGSGIRTEDIKLALRGHVKEGYKFNPSSPLSAEDPGYISSPSISDRVHVLVCIYTANASQMKQGFLRKMKEIREAASDLGIPQLAILTHVDEACGETEKNLRNVYKSKYLKKKMGDFSSSVGIPMNRILPVKNYSKEIELNPDIDTLIMSALKLMIDFGDDYAAKL
ncbi:interferon-induced protein 44-like [Fundulus diaphanus]